MLVSFSIYHLFFKHNSFRTNTLIAQSIHLTGICIDLWQAYRYNIALGIPDMAVLAFCASVQQTFYYALTLLPHLVLVQ